MMGILWRVFAPEFMDEAVRLVISTGRPGAVAAGERRMRKQPQGRWVNLLKDRQDNR